MTSRINYKTLEELRVKNEFEKDKIEPPLTQIRALIRQFDDLYDDLSWTFLASSLLYYVVSLFANEITRWNDRATDLFLRLNTLI